MVDLSLLTVVYLVIVFTCLVFVYQHLSSPLRSVPGPFLTRFTKLWYFIRVRKGRFEHDNISLHQKYGKVVRYGPDEYSIDDPEAVKTIYGYGTRFYKSDWYSGWGLPKVYTLFTQQDIQAHAQLRRKYQSTYSMSSLVTYEAYVDDCATIFCKVLEEMAKSDRLVNMGRWFQYYAFDVIGDITFSQRFGFLDEGRDIGGMIGAVHSNMVMSTMVGIYAALWPYIFKGMKWLSERGWIDSTPRLFLNNYARTRIAERSAALESDEKLEKTDAQDESKPRDFLAKFLDFHRQNPQNFSDYNILVGLMGNIIAGSDTTSNSLSAILYYLLKYPATMRKLQDEVSAFEKRGELSDPATFKESQHMPYLQAVMKEALRMHPASGLPLARVVPKGGAEICGYFFPQGAVVGINTWVAHYNTSVFGADAAKFRPERWIDSDEETLASMEHYYMPFGLGSRACIGKHISILEMSKLVPQLVRKFDFELGDGLKGDGSWRTDNKWFVKPENFEVKMRLRNR